MLDLVALIHDRGADIISIAEPEVNTTATAGKLVFSVFAIVAQFEQDRIVQRTREGLARAKANGTRLGRPKRLDEKQIKSVRLLRKQGRSYSVLAEVFNVSRTTVRKYCEGFGTSSVSET